MKKELWEVVHVCEYIDHYTSNVEEDYKTIGMVMATEEEMAEYLRKYNKPCVYETSCNVDLYCHKILASKVKPVDISEIQPYGELTEYYDKQIRFHNLNKNYESKYGGLFNWDQDVHEQYLKECAEIYPENFKEEEV